MNVAVGVPAQLVDELLPRRRQLHAVEILEHVAIVVLLAVLALARVVDGRGETAHVGQVRDQPREAVGAQEAGRVDPRERIGLLECARIDRSQRLRVDVCHCHLRRPARMPRGRFA
jgi:hypothetical protein